ncbi:restriction modification system DNA specificity subunit [Nostoc sp. NIES-2111]|nr:restriction modification system DNA specificity subunit [Nostoc sp. NIES-2111]
MSEELRELPEGWEWATLGALLLNIQYGYTASATDQPTGVKFLRITDLQNNFVDWETVPFCNCSEIAKYQLSEGDIVIARTGATTGKSFLLKKIPETTVFASYLIRLHTSSLYPPEYLALFMQSADYWQQITTVSKGTAQPGANASILSQLIIPVPPVKEQKQIIAKIEELNDRTQRAKEALDSIPQLCDRFRQSVLAAAFRGDLTADWREQNPDVESPFELIERIYKLRKQQYEKDCIEVCKQGKKQLRKPSNLKPQIRDSEYLIEIPESWFWSSFEDISSIKQYAMSSGPFGSALGTKDYKDSGIPVIRGQNIQNGKFLLSNFVYVSEEKALELSRSTAYPGDIVIVAVGSSGQAALVPDSLHRAILSQNCNKFTVDKLFVDPKFIVLSLQNEIAKSQMQEKTTDTVRQFLSLTNLKSTLFPIPPLNEQHEIVKRVEILFGLISQIQNQHKKVESDLVKINQSILAKAFQGELVPQNPDDEPASVLLERIRAEREKLNNSKPKSRGTSKGKSKTSQGQVSIPGLE